MKSLPTPWLNLTGDDEREFEASQALATATKLLQSDGWQQVATALEAEVAATFKQLARSSQDDEQNRGVIRALEHVLSMPGDLARAASTELEKHR